MESVGAGRFRVVVGASRAVRGAVVRGWLGADVYEDSSAADWPFRRRTTPEALSPSARVWIRDLHSAFPAHQAPGTRLVLTQSTYQLQRWLDWLDAHPGVLVAADADGDALGRSAPEAFAGRGPWARIRIEALEGTDDTAGAETSPLSPLQAAFRQSDPDRRYFACERALAVLPGDPALLLAAASAAMERLRLDDARELLERANAAAPDWEAVHFETGKLWLRADDTERAASAFAEAGRLMPSFAAAFTNLGAALGELERHDEAIAALEQALRFDPAGHTIINNLGAVFRDTGRLAEAEASFRRVIELQPRFVFGYYNLAHTLFLQGRFADARDAYVEGMHRDPQRNARQAGRLLVARAAAGDAAGALADLEALAERVPAEPMGDLAEEAESTLTALSAIPGIDHAGVARVLERVRLIPRS